MKTVLSIAGSDSIGGAGIQADIKTITMQGCYAMTAITALTAQNTLGVQAISPVSPEFLTQQLESVFSDIYPDAIKIGMLANSQVIDTVNQILDKYPSPNIVIDPVMVATSGDVLLKNQARDSLDRLLPKARLITPNTQEAETLSGMKIESESDMINVARHLYNKYQTAILLKGGHFGIDCNDLLYDGQIHWYHSRRIDNDNTHGTGCTLSSCIAAYLARGESLHESINKAKTYISGAIDNQMNLGHGRGPLNHTYTIKEDE